MLLIGCQPEELEDYGGSLRPQREAGARGRAGARPSTRWPLGRTAGRRGGAARRPRRGRPSARSRWRPTSPGRPAEDEACRDRRRALPRPSPGWSA
ncbi:MAG: hypothetical protein MZW92_57540 [Comamonadaceae bacterium]|nr:hypothetical protein [Comamonadaceae bacterium]